MLFADWVAITVLVLLLVRAASAWIRQHKSALMQQAKNPPFSKRTAEERRDWSYTKDRIGQQLEAYYQALATEELPPRLLALLKKFDEEIEPSRVSQGAVVQPDAHAALVDRWIQKPCFVVIDGAGQKLVYVYFEDEP